MRLQIQVAEMRFLWKVDELFFSDRVSKVELWTGNFNLLKAADHRGMGHGIVRDRINNLEQAHASTYMWETIF